ncbi:ATP-grasp domain-containing protein [Cellvibrio japonicus]|uniref:Putative phosphoribosylglycinamide synthetase n=1 Tax=Cellvibrio japonicus (strain Ueda107) TaxID=498211 RepID=B3PIQ7_CELJU|nr:ATP-grasp domain-containing protein [Cellvibrio japonicus]ACE83397.1 putative phosphoribosylglycinamide synthetase [Cellvibrio japonicus Ueda107]QEI13971.1 ATP-grasp domain-containing protein [Cellvibrio japonicus]QEI17545.1 ATP-grasp domain-containing protein [Cellvibrio japonicus]QEI21121.1 ATP-grasp domain-containing protein [Cellvibrio japonicus]
MKISKAKILLVDSYSLGAGFSSVLNGLGYECLHVRSSKNLPEKLQNSFIETNFSKCFCVDAQGINNILNSLEKENIQLVMAGSEPGVETADIIADYLGISYNNFSLSAARRNKYLMHESLKKANIPSMNHFCSSSLIELQKWIGTNISGKCVLKPCSGGGGQNVFICESEKEVENAYKQIIGTGNLFNQPNHEVLAQGFLSGQEYIVNSVSRNGKPYFTDIWEINKGFFEQHAVCSYADSVNVDSDVWKILTSYAESALHALGIKFGPAHCEIMMTTSGPILIECGARFEGAVDMAAIASHYETNQFLATIDACFSPEKFDALLRKPRHPNPEIMRHIYLMSHSDGLLRRNPDFQEIAQIQSFFSLTSSLCAGMKLEKTIDLFKSPGFAYLRGHPKKMKEDYELFRELESRIYNSALI